MAGVFTVGVGAIGVGGKAGLIGAAVLELTAGACTTGIDGVGVVLGVADTGAAAAAGSCGGATGAPAGAGAGFSAGGITGLPAGAVGWLTCGVSGMTGALIIGADAFAGAAACWLKSSCAALTMSSRVTCDFTR